MVLPECRFSGIRSSAEEKGSRSHDNRFKALSGDEIPDV